MFDGGARSNGAAWSWALFLANTTVAPQCAEVHDTQQQRQPAFFLAAAASGLCTQPQTAMFAEMFACLKGLYALSFFFQDVSLSAPLPEPPPDDDLLTAILQGFS